MTEMVHSFYLHQEERREKSRKEKKTPEEEIDQNNLTVVEAHL